MSQEKTSPKKNLNVGINKCHFEKCLYMSIWFVLFLAQNEFFYNIDKMTSEFLDKSIDPCIQEFVFFFCSMGDL